ncbi:hypothetical protein BJ944DRAFT_261955 [Cunninghamella echinulata]|nr:hypothetical protein BJ944DRAFT_261955 [Cunninghamella echinulata]
MLTASENENIIHKCEVEDDILQSSDSDDDDLYDESIIQDYNNDDDNNDGTQIIWSQTHEFISISLTTSCVMSCVIYPNILILSPVETPDIVYKLPFYKNINHQPLKLSIVHEQWRIVYLSKEKPEIWPQLFNQPTDKTIEQNIEVVYNEQHTTMDMNHHHHNNNNNNMINDKIDIDKILNAHGNKTGLEME